MAEGRTLESFQLFQNRLQKEMLSHAVIHDNAYCRWFAQADLTPDNVRYMIIQFSVFSNLFLVAQLHKMLNAYNLEEMRSAKEILANEIGAIFRTDSNTSSTNTMFNTEGTVDGGRFRFKAAHFEWLLNFAAPLGLAFKDLGKRRHGSRETLFFCDELCRIYGSEDFNESAGASYAVEHWAAAGFWKDLISGLERFKSRHVPELRLGFFKWHDRVEDQHKEHTEDELRDLYLGDAPFDEDRFIAAGIEMLDGVETFWRGLNDERLGRS